MHDILLELASPEEYPDILKRWAELLVLMNLADRYGVYARPKPRLGVVEIYLAAYQEPYSTPDRGSNGQKLYGE